MVQDEQKPQPVSIAEVKVEAKSPEAWLSHRFAPEWFSDALAEAQKPCNPGTPENCNSRRREIVFAVCCAESYLYEWILHEKFMNDLPSIRIVKLRVYFPVGDKRGTYDQWKEVTKKFLENKFPKANRYIDFGGTAGQAWKYLTELRNGLVHANASRPDVGPSKEQPQPSFSEIILMKRGWPTRVVIELIKLLHKAAGTKPPEWLVEP